MVNARARVPWTKGVLVKLLIGSIIFTVVGAVIMIGEWENYQHAVQQEQNCIASHAPCAGLAALEEWPLFQAGLLMVALGATLSVGASVVLVMKANDNKCRPLQD